MIKKRPFLWIKCAHLWLILPGLITTLACHLVPATEAPPQPTPTALQYSLGLTSASAGLNELTSYRANLTINFEGSRNGQSTAGQIESLTETTQQPAAFHQFTKTDIVTSTARLPQGISEFFRFNDTIYAKKADQDSWLTFTSTADFGLVDLERFIVLPSAVSSPPQPETLNGLMVEHYTFDEDDLTNPDIIFEQTQGDLWLAPHGNFVMQYIISTSVSIVNPSLQTDFLDRGQLTLHYRLTDINTGFTITPPANALAGANDLNDLPRLADAELISVLPTLIEYTSAISSISATIFYRDELFAQEWTENSAAIFNEKAQLTFSKKNQTLTVIINPSDEPDKIKVVLDLKTGP